MRRTSAGPNRFASQGLAKSRLSASPHVPDHVQYFTPDASDASYWPSFAFAAMRCFRPLFEEVQHWRQRLPPRPGEGSAIMVVRVVVCSFACIATLLGFLSGGGRTRTSKTNCRTRLFDYRS